MSMPWSGARRRWTGVVLAAASLTAMTACNGSTGSADPAGTGRSPTIASSDGTGSPAAPAVTPSRPPAGNGPAGHSGFHTYVALGDSYTAAPGVAQSELASGCLRSTHNYPARLARTLGTAYVDVSCGGAVTGSLVGGQQTSVAAVPPQLDALAARPDLVTVGIGGNDEGFFGGLIVACLQAAQQPGPAPCRAANRAGGHDQFVDKLGQITGLVATALGEVRDRAPDATVVLVGYPQLVPANGTCADLPLAPGDYPYVHSLGVKLDQALAAAARAADVTYVDVLTASRGHDVCAGAAAWVNGATNAPGRAIAFHPFANEQAAVAALIARAVT